MEVSILLAEDGGSNDNNLIFDNKVKARVDLKPARLFTPAHSKGEEGFLIDLNLTADSATLIEERTAP